MKPLMPESRRGFRQVIFAKNQPQYLQLPANTDGHQVETKWKLSWSERIHCLLRGSLYLTFLTFGQPLQPTRLSVLRDPQDEAPDIEPLTRRDMDISELPPQPKKISPA